MSPRKEVIGDAVLWLGDCGPILAEMADHSVNIVTDPPYGIGEAAGRNKTRGKSRGSAQGGGNSNALAFSRDYGDDAWDNEPISAAAIQEMQRVAQGMIMFGGNFYAMPPSSCWLVWDKENGATDFADSELAWTNLKRAVRLLRFRWNGLLQADMANKEQRVHPTQKPVPVLQWCLGWLPKDGLPALDPYMGSGTCGIACANLGIPFIGIEREPKYFDIACRRIELAYNQQRIPLED